MSEPMTEQGRELLRTALGLKDQAAMDHLLFHIAVMDVFGPAEVETVLRQELAVAPHDVQEFWLGECNCDGHQN